MTKFVKCTVKVSRLRIEVFDKNTGEPVVEDKKDWNGEPYKETKEVTYRRGDEIFLPVKIMEKLGRSVEPVMAPVAMEMVEEEPEEPPEGDFKDNSKGETVADMIPPEKETPKKPAGRGRTSTKK